MKKYPHKNAFERFSLFVTHFAGSSKAFIIALITVLLWALLGPLFHYSENWQLVINTGTTIITFLMVFLIQHSQNKDSMSVHLKLNEIVASINGASNRLINVEELTEQELLVLQKYYSKLVQMAKKDENLGKSHSVEEATEKHKKKIKEFPKEHLQ